MPGYYLIYLIILLTGSFLLVRYLILRKQSVAMLLFMDATKAETQGKYVEAVNAYENALNEVNKSKFHRQFKLVIINKLKLLQTIITYESHQAFVRKDNSWIN